MGRTTTDYHLRAVTIIVIGSCYYEALYTAATIIVIWSYCEYNCTHYYQCCAARLGLILEGEYARTYRVYILLSGSAERPPFSSTFRFECKAGPTAIQYVRIDYFRVYVTGSRDGLVRPLSLLLHCCCCSVRERLRVNKITAGPSNRLRILRCCCQVHMRGTTTLVKVGRFQRERHPLQRIEGYKTFQLYGP